MIKITYSEHTYFRNLLSHKPTLIDLGGCLGNFSKHFLEYYPESKILLLEASKTNFDNINITDPRFTKIHGAISHKKGKINFKEDLSNIQAGSFVFDNTSDHSYMVDSYTLEELCNQFDYIDLIKMDVEGAEWDIIMNSPDDIFKKIGQLSIEFHDFLDISRKTDTEKCVNRLKTLGYSMISQSTDYMFGTEYFDCLFYKKIYGNS
jgi:FkbM family methyltransferase